MSDIPTVDVHPGGDVILICDNDERTEKRRLRVSSMILKHISPVFRAMLGPHFSEGTALANSSRVEIPLPDDDPESMESVCYLLHMRNNDVPATLDFENLIEVVKHCDKYGVWVATRPAIYQWLDACPKFWRALNACSARQLMGIAFKLKLWKHVKRFGVITAQQAEYSIRDECDECPLPDYMDMPFYLLDQLDKLKLDTLHKMHTAIDHEISEFLSYRGRNGKCVGDCEGANTHKMQVLKQLRQKQLWPWVPGDGEPLDDLWFSMSFGAAENIDGVKKCCADCTVTTIVSAQELVRHMRKAMRRALNEMESDTRFDTDENDGMVLGFTF